MRRTTLATTPRRQCDECDWSKSCHVVRGRSEAAIRVLGALSTSVLGAPLSVGLKIIKILVAMDLLCAT